MKTFILTLLFLGATFFPILFIPLMVLTMVIVMIVAPHIYDMWAGPKRST